MLTCGGQELLKEHRVTITGLTDLDFVIDRNQNGNDVSTTCNCPTDANSNCLYVGRVCGHLIASFFF